jgi:hypothetical protein
MLKTTPVIFDLHKKIRRMGGGNTEHLKFAAETIGKEFELLKKFPFLTVT